MDKMTRNEQMDTHSLSSEQILRQKKSKRLVLLFIWLMLLGILDQKGNLVNFAEKRWKNNEKELIRKKYLMPVGWKIYKPEIVSSRDSSMIHWLSLLISHVDLNQEKTYPITIKFDHTQLSWSLQTIRYWNWTMFMWFYITIQDWSNHHLVWFLHDVHVTYVYWENSSTSLVKVVLEEFSKKKGRVNIDYR